MSKKYLPIGTVVRLKGATKDIMITGYISKGDNDKIYDYNGCISPEGYMENTFCLFNTDEIEDVIYLGLEDEEYEKYEQNLNTSIQSVSISHGLKKEATKKNVNEVHHGRIPKEPTNPKSISEMRAQYGVKKLSGKNN